MRVSKNCQINHEMQENTIQLSKIDIFQGDYQVLNGISMELEASEFAYLIGKTGSGKTSLLKTIYGILPLRNGAGTVAGFDLKTLDRHTLPLLRRKVGFVFQDFILLMDRSVEENLLFALRATGWKDQHKMQLKIEEVLILVGMQGVEHKMPHQLSGGEQQRIVIARALLNKPELIIADEATGNLDPQTAEEIVILLRHLAKNHHTAVLFATHNYQLIKRFPARIIQCEKGALVEDFKTDNMSSLSELYKR